MHWNIIYNWKEIEKGLCCILDRKHPRQAYTLKHWSLMGLFGEVLDTAVGSDQAEEQVTEGMSLKGLSCVDPS